MTLKIFEIRSILLERATESVPMRVLLQCGCINSLLLLAKGNDYPCIIFQRCYAVIRSLLGVD